MLYCSTANANCSVLYNEAEEVQPRLIKAALYLYLFTKTVHSNLGHQLSVVMRPLGIVAAVKIVSVVPMAHAKTRNTIKAAR